MVSNIDAKIHAHRAASEAHGAARAARGTGHHFASILTHARQPKADSTEAASAELESATATAARSATQSDGLARIATTDQSATGAAAAASRTSIAHGTPASTTEAQDPSAPVSTVGTLSEDPRTAGMYIPPDFYHGTSYSPVFDAADGTHQPRFEGQKIYSQWRGSAPADFDPNARVMHDPLNSKQGPNWWKQDESGNWVRRPEGYGGIPLNDDGTPIFTPDPTKYPEYYEV